MARAPADRPERIGGRARAGPSGTAGRPTSRSADVQGPEGRGGLRSRSLQSQLSSAQGELQSAIDARLRQEIQALTVRYSGDEALAERVARARAERGFAASDPDFETQTLAPLRQKVTELEEQIRRAAQRRGVQTIGGNGGDRLGG